MSCSSNSKIIGVCNGNSLDEEHMLEMVDYLIVEPPFTASPNRSHKLPFVACQVFCSEIDHIQQLLFENGNARIL